MDSAIGCPAVFLGLVKHAQNLIQKMSEVIPSSTACSLFNSSRNSQKKHSNNDIKHHLPRLLTAPYHRQKHHHIFQHIARTLIITTPTPGALNTSNENRRTSPPHLHRHCQLILHKPNLQRLGHGRHKHIVELR